MAKFKEKDVVLLSKKQTVIGTPVTPAAADALLVTELTYKDSISKDTNVYMGDSLSRDEENTITDHYAELTGKFFMPLRGATEPTLSTDFLWEEWFMAVGGNVTITGTTPNKVVNIDNTVATTTSLTQQFREASLDVVTQKLYNVFDALGTLDLSIEIMKRAMLTFNMKGNYTQPTQVAAISPDYGVQKALIAGIINSSNIIASEITGTIGGNTHTGDTGTVKNICFYKLDAPNLFGFDINRFMTSCETSFDKQSVPTDVTLSVLEDIAYGIGSGAGNEGASGAAATAYDPYNHKGDYHKFTLKFGTGTGKNVSIYFDQLQLVDIGSGTYNNFKTKELKFRNIGKTTLKLS